MTAAEGESRVNGVVDGVVEGYDEGGVGGWVDGMAGRVGQSFKEGARRRGWKEQAFSIRPHLQCCESSLYVVVE